MFSSRYSGEAARIRASSSGLHSQVQLFTLKRTRQWGEVESFPLLVWAVQHLDLLALHLYLFTLSQRFAFSLGVNAVRFPAVYYNHQLLRQGRARSKSVLCSRPWGPSSLTQRRARTEGVAWRTEDMEREESFISFIRGPMNTKKLRSADCPLLSVGQASSLLPPLSVK